MIMQKFSVNQHPIQHVLSWIQAGEIAIPEIQRPFVWDSKKVRDFIDSLYRGYPVGYIIIWQNPNVKLKDGVSSKGKKILIDGQQRITALMTAILGIEILDEDYRKRRISIAFNPIDEIFEVSNPVIQKDKRWISDISKVFSSDFQILAKLNEYCSNNLGVHHELMLQKFDSLRGILNIPIGLIELNSELDIGEVTEIFIRINSSGVILSQADFAMSKIAVDEKFGGQLMRKTIDYFCHMAAKPEFYYQLIENDKDFIKTEYFKKMSWLKDYKSEIYDPSYTDMLRVIFTSQFNRGKLQDFVALLSGRDFETRQYKEEITQKSFENLKDGIEKFMNETNFKNFVMIIHSAGFIDNSMIRSQNVLNFAYILYLKLKEKNISQQTIESLVRKWFVLSVLTGRYSGDPESQFDMDIKRIDNNPLTYIEDVIKAQLSDTYWEIGLPQQFDTSVASSPEFNVFLASQVKMGDKGFLSRDIKVEDLIKLKGDVHHIFPKDYLKKIGFSSRSQYNQIANYVMAQSEINIKIGKKSPKTYFEELKNQCVTKKCIYGNINNFEELKENLNQHCIPEEVLDGLIEDYEKFLKKRRIFMAQKIKNYFEKL